MLPITGSTRFEVSEQWYRNIFYSAPAGIVVTDTEGIILHANAQADATFGYAEGELAGRSIALLIPPEKRASYLRRFTVFLANTKSGNPPFDIAKGPFGYRKNGIQFPVDFTLSLLRDSNGRVNAICAAVCDISEIWHMGELLRKREGEYRTLVENFPDLIVRFDRNCRRTFINHPFDPSAGRAAAECLGSTPLECWAVPTVPAQAFQDMLQRVLAEGSTGKAILDWQKQDGERLCMTVNAVPEFDANGAICSVLTISRDITAVSQAQESLYKREQEFRSLVEHSPDAIGRYDGECRRVYANPRLMESLGGDKARILGSTPSQFPGGTAAAKFAVMLQEVLESGEERAFELRWKDATSDYCTYYRMIPEFDRTDKVANVLAIGRDITAIDRYRKKVHDQAFYDSLTGLPNRYLVFDRINQAIADSAYNGHQFGLMLLDLDNFKEVNDTLGHSAGDRLLCEVAQRMQDCVRQYDTVARLGGDEFAVLLPNMRKGDDLATIANKMLRELAEPFQIEGRESFVTASVGIAFYPDDSKDGHALYQFADSAMYHAKKMGRNNFQFYAKELTARSMERMEIEAALRKAQRRGELELHYQPKVDLRTGCLVGCEALLRWNRRGHGVMMPERFIPIAEDSGLILGIGEWVLRQACDAATTWNRRNGEKITVAVNLSTRQFIRNDLVGSVRRILAETGCRPEWLELEITESLLLEDSSEVSVALAQLRDMGLRIAIDDFGTGYSALSYLNRFAVSQLKIDRSFVKDIPQQRQKMELVKAMLSIASALHLESVAEGVETVEQAEYLMAHGCQLAQGFLFGRPMTYAEFNVELLQQDELCANEFALD